MRPFLAALLLLAAPAAAQEEPDLSAQLAQAARVFSWPGVASFDGYDRSDDDPFMALLPTLEGDWSMDVIDPATGALDPARLAKGCEEPSTLVQTDTRTFEFRPLRWHGDWLDVSATVRFDYVAAHMFQRSIREEDWIAAWEEAEEGYTPYFFTAPLFRGEIFLFHPSPDVLVLFDPEGPPELLARCP